MNFQERFKGKTSLMTKNGPSDLLVTQQNPIPKFIETAKPLDSQKSISYKPLKLPLQTYNAKYPPTQDSSTKLNPFLMNNPYFSNEEVENHQNTYNSRQNLNNFQAHLLKGSPSMKNSGSNYKDILVTNSRNIMLENPFEGKEMERNEFMRRPPSYENMNNKFLPVNRKATSANGGKFENDTGLKYTPYTLKEYNELQKSASSTAQKGLGPNINTEDWLFRKEKLEKMINFSQNVKLFNSKKISETQKNAFDFERQQDEKLQNKSKRQKAIEFAKNIPKPVFQVKRISGNNESKEQKEFRNELELLEQQHLKLLNEIEKNVNSTEKKK